MTPPPREKHLEGLRTQIAEDLRSRAPHPPLKRPSRRPDPVPRQGDQSGAAS